MKNFLLIDISIQYGVEKAENQVLKSHLTSNMNIAYHLARRVDPVFFHHQTHGWWHFLYEVQWDLLWLFPYWEFVPEIKRNWAWWLHNGECKSIDTVMGEAMNVAGSLGLTLYENMEGTSAGGKWPSEWNGVRWPGSCFCFLSGSEHCLCTPLWRSLLLGRSLVPRGRCVLGPLANGDRSL